MTYAFNNHSSLRIDDQGYILAIMSNPYVRTVREMWYDFIAIETSFLLPLTLRSRYRFQVPLQSRSYVYFLSESMLGSKR